MNICHTVYESNDFLICSYSKSVFLELFLIFIALWLAYISISWLNRRPSRDIGCIGDILFGGIISFLLACLSIGVIDYKKDTLPSVIMVGGLLTIIGMGVYGLLNNALEINLSTKRHSKNNSLYDFVSLNIGLSKPKYTRVRILSIKICLDGIQNNHKRIARENILNDKINLLARELMINPDNYSLLTLKPDGGVFLVPGDKVSYDLPAIDIESSEIILFNVAILCQQVILGIPIRWSRPQWTSSVVSFPLEKGNKTD